MPRQALTCVVEAAWRLMPEELPWPGLGLLKAPTKILKVEALLTAMNCWELLASTLEEIGGTEAGKLSEGSALSMGEEPDGGIPVHPAGNSTNNDRNTRNKRCKELSSGRLLMFTVLWRAVRLAGKDKESS